MFTAHGRGRVDPKGSRRRGIVRACVCACVCACTLDFAHLSETSGGTALGGEPAAATTSARGVGFGCTRRSVAAADNKALGILHRRTNCGRSTQDAALLPPARPP
jgi:hypothetical protein